MAWTHPYFTLHKWTMNNLYYLSFLWILKSIFVTVSRECNEGIFTEQRTNTEVEL